MHISQKRSFGAVRPEASVGWSTLAGLVIVLAAGCASPGPPLPPSLKLPQVATKVTAARVGDAVILRWTTPTRTTDKLLIAGPIRAEICRSTIVAGVAPAAASAKTTSCAPVVERVPVTPGESVETEDKLPETLSSVLPQVLAYQVQLLNAAGRTAGPSAVVYAAAGEAPGPVKDLHAKSTKQGVVLEWKGEPGPADSRNLRDNPLQLMQELATTVELDRTTVAAPAPAAASAPKPNTSNPFGTPKESTQARFVAGNVDAGGTTDRSAQLGRTYRYTAQRVRSMTFNQQTLELRSAPSAEVTVDVRDVFPPDVPTGLVAVPELASTGAVPGVASIDLSWDPNPEPHIAGYHVYRRDLDSGAPNDAPVAWHSLNPDLVRVASYRDSSVAAGKRYAYRVTAVSESGNESPPSAPASEAAPTPESTPAP